MSGEDAPALTRRFADLKVRLISAIVVAAVALACIWFGGIWAVLLAMVAASAMALELRSIVFHGGAPAGRDALPAILAVSSGALIAVLAMPALGLLVLGTVAALSSARDRSGNADADAVRVMLAGTIVIGAAAIAFVSVRAVEPYGFLSILWAALVVVAADVGGYFGGRLIGGPKLWPRVSPKKTWAGLGGGIALAFVVGGLFSWATTGTYFYQVCIVSMIAAVVAQGGDLMESALKRHFGVKDASGLIPGHGGVLDRLDGHMAAILVAAVVTFSRGQAVFIW